MKLGCQKFTKNSTFLLLEISCGKDVLSSSANCRKLFVYIWKKEILVNASFLGTNLFMLSKISLKFILSIIRTFNLIRSSISFRGTNLNHYEVVRSAEGFKINVDNKVCKFDVVLSTLL